MMRYVVTHVVTEESHFGEESHLSTTISSAFPKAEHQPDGIWIIDCDMTAEDLLAKVSEGVSEESVMIAAIPGD
jgi:hypothetical protein